MGSEIRDGFIRQRRNLIISSLLLLFAQFSGLSIEKLNVFGNELKLAHPYSVTTAIWIATWYWLIRYYQYLRDLNTTEIKDAYLGKFNSYIPKIALAHLKEKHPEFLEPPADRPNAKVSLELVEYLSYQATRNFHRGTVQSAIIMKDINFGSRQEVGPVEVIIEKKYLLWPRVLSVLHIFFNTTKFTEYVLPFLIFLLPVVYSINSYIFHHI